MLEFNANEEKGIIEIIVDGKITQEDFYNCKKPIEETIKRHGRIKILEQIRELPGFDPSFVWEGIKFDIKHMKDISHCAVVSDKGWVGPFAKAAGVFISCKIRVFGLNELNEARKWLESE
jgi:hypothetical protein